MAGAYYRGGKDLTPKSNELKIDRKTGLVEPSRGISLNNDPAQLSRFGGAYRVKSIPPELEIVQQGKNKHHFELRPRAAMPLDQYRNLLGQIELEETATS
jgi:hypothetical protein